MPENRGEGHGRLVQRLGRQRRHRGELGHARHKRRHRAVLGRLDVFARGQAHGLVVVRRDVAPSWIEDPFGVAGVTVPDETELDPPQVVVPFGGVPLDLVGGHAATGQPFGDEVAEGGTGSGVTRQPHGAALRLLSHVLTFLEDGALEPSHTLDRDARRVGDLLSGLAGTDPGLDLLGAQRTLHFDLVLAETGEVAADGSTEPVVDGQREPGAPAGCRQHEVGPVLAHRDESELLHASPFVVVLNLPPDP